MLSHRKTVALFLGFLIIIFGISLNNYRMVKDRNIKIEAIEEINDKLGDDKAKLLDEKQQRDEKIEELILEVNDKVKKIKNLEEEINNLNQKNNELNNLIKELKANSNKSNEDNKRASSRSSSLNGFSNFKATTYSTYANGDKLAGKQWGNKTATGTTVRQGRTIAVDPNIIPLGSKVEIIFGNGFDYLNGIYTAEDTGNAIKGNKIDVYLDNYKECIRFGVRNILIKKL